MRPSSGGWPRGSKKPSCVFSRPFILVSAAVFSLGFSRIQIDVFVAVSKL